MAGESHAFALNATIPYDSFESSSILLRGDFVPAPRNGGEQMLHNLSLKSGGADMLRFFRAVASVLVQVNLGCGGRHAVGCFQSKSFQ